MTYDVYIKSQHWKNFRLQTLRHRFQCEVCANRRFLQVHHRNYECVGKEEQSDVLVLCRRCHGKLHKRAKDLRPDSLEESYQLLLKLFVSQKEKRERKYRKRHIRLKKKNGHYYQTNKKRPLTPLKGILSPYQDEKIRK